MNENEEAIIDDTETGADPAETQAPAVIGAQAPAQIDARPLYAWDNPALLNKRFKSAQSLSQADFLPDGYRGNPYNCLVAIEYGIKLQISPLDVMQCLYIVKGKFSWSGQACAGMIQSNPAFYSNTYDVVYTGEPGTPSRGCYIRIMRRFDSKWIYGTEVTMAMAAAEGWLSKAGSKWQTMPDQMLAYRAAAFFARVYCPTTFSGQTVEEMHDVHGYEEEKKTKTTLTLEAQ